MDKTLVNHQIVSMRKLVRIAKRHVQQKLFKQINQLKKKASKFESNEIKEDTQNAKVDKVVRKLNNKLKSRQNELIELKSIQPDLISKNALSHKMEHFQTTIQKSDRVPVQNRLIALVCMQKTVQNCVEKFKSENPNCEEWLPVLIELWDEQRKSKAAGLPEKFSKQKKNLQQNSKQPKKEKNKVEKANNNDKVEEEFPIKSKQTPTKPKMKKKKSPSKVYTPSFEVTELEESSPTSFISSHSKDSNLVVRKSNLLPTTFQSSSGAPAIIKRLDLRTGDIDIPDSKFQPNDNSKTKVARRRMMDDFFTSANGDSDEEFGPDRSRWNEPDSEPDDEADSSDMDDHHRQQQNNPIRSTTNITRLKSSFTSNGTSSEPTGRFHNQQRQQARTSTGNPQHFNLNQKGSKSVQKEVPAEEENLHPSWLAKKAAADKMKSLFNNPVAKRIKFD